MRFGEFSATEVTLSPSGEDGCQLIAQETSTAFSGSAAVYLLRPGGLLASRVATYDLFDGRSVFAGGHYRLTWSGTEGRLRITGVDPLATAPGVLLVHC